MTRYFTSCLLLISFLSVAQKPVPDLWGHRVHDDAKVLSQATIAQLEQQLKVYEDSTSNQIVILIIASLEDEVLEEYSLRVAETWKLGQKEKDNGALLLVSVDDRKMRIEVGEGLEGVLTDALSNRIIRNEMAPEFRRGDYDAGIIAGLNGMIAAIGGEYIADEDFTPGEMDMSLGEKIFVSLFIFGILGLFTFIGLISGKTGWILYFFLMPFWGLFPLLFLGTSIYLFYTYLVLFPIIKMLLSRTNWGSRMEKSMNSGSSSRSGGGWSTGSSWSSGGGGGFSGGGGSFGGGGSSGSW